MASGYAWRGTPGLSRQNAEIMLWRPPPPDSAQTARPLPASLCPVGVCRNTALVPGEPCSECRAIFGPFLRCREASHG